MKWMMDGMDGMDGGAAVSLCIEVLFTYDTPGKWRVSKWPAWRR